MKSWYIRNNDEHLGPYSMEELKLLGVYSDDFVWKEGLPAWTKACMIPELNDLLITVEHVIFPKDEEPKEADIMACPSFTKLTKLNMGLGKLFSGKALGSIFKRNQSNI